MHNVIISDTSCFIVLSKIGELQLLKLLYGEVFTTPEIAEEFGESLPAWVKIKSVKDIQKQRILELQVDKGESSAIVLALETENATLILDDEKARKVARQLGIEITGTLGVIVKAKMSGHISLVKPLLEKIGNSDFRITQELLNIVLKVSGES